MAYTEIFMDVRETIKEKLFQYLHPTSEISCKELPNVSHLSYAYQSIGRDSLQIYPSDLVAYSREEMDEKLNEIYTIQYDSMNDFKCKLDSVYHPLNDKIIWLTKTLQQLSDNVIIILKRQTREIPARISMPSTSTNNRRIPSTDPDYSRSIDGNFSKSIDRRFMRLEDKLYSFEETLGHSYYPMSDDMDALSKRMYALQQEMEIIQKQLDSQQKTPPPIYTPTHISVVYPQAPADEQTESIDTSDVASIDCYTNHYGWNSEFHYKPKYGARAHDTHMGYKRSWSDTSEDPATQRRKATYTKEEVDKMIAEIYDTLKYSEDDYYKDLMKSTFPLIATSLLCI
ncbi:hypothetical protein Rs2_35543 [Raphanus sativus]|nr:hypothetical protein Rs2_35543 [Raphanus sativus]